jgi:hypothetical protein
MTKENLKKEAKKTRMIWITLAIVALLLAIFFLLHTFRDRKNHGFFGPPISQNFHKKKLDLADIQGWMTFDFLNKAFGLPSDYLKKELVITDRKYPNITIDRWAKNNQENPSILLDRIKKLIQDSKNPAPPEINPGI